MPQAALPSRPFGRDQCAKTLAEYRHSGIAKITPRYAKNAPRSRRERATNRFVPCLGAQSGFYGAAGSDKTGCGTGSRWWRWSIELACSRARGRRRHSLRAARRSVLHQVAGRSLWHMCWLARSRWHFGGLSSPAAPAVAGEASVPGRVSNFRAGPNAAAPPCGAGGQARHRAGRR